MDNNKEKVLNEIRLVLGGTLNDLKSHRRFEMSGYEENTGDCVKNNIEIILLFAHYGIFDSVSFLTIDFHKGSGTIYLQYYGEENLIQVDVSGMGTCEIIYQIFELTIYTYAPKRRRRS